MKQLRKYVLLFLLSLSLLNFLHAQNPGGFIIKHYDNSSGLSNSSVNKIFTDSDDILWVGTWDGLNQYDGTEFWVFNYSRDGNDRSIGNNVIQSITEDGHHNIWMSTVEGVTKYSKANAKFSNYFYNKHGNTKISEQEYGITTDTSGNLYCYDKTTGLSLYNAHLDTLQPLHWKHPVGNIIKLLFDKANHLWLLTDKGTLEKYRLTSHSPKPQFLLGRSLNISNFFIVNHRFFFISSGHLFEMNTENGVEKKILPVPSGVTDIVLYKSHYIISNPSTGLEVFDQDFSRAHLFDDEMLKNIKDLKITSLTSGPQNILWIGTDGNGFIQISPKTKSFQTVATSSNNSFNKAVRAFCKDKENLWVATKGNGILIYPHFWKENKSLSPLNISVPQLDNNYVYSLKATKNGLILIGSDGEGLTIYDSRTQKFVKWHGVKDHEKWPAFASVYAIHEDDDGSLWLGTSGYGLIHLRIERHLNDFTISYLKKYAFDNSSSGPANDIIYSISPSGNNKLWIGCRYGGLNLFHKSSELFDTYKAFTYEGSLSNNDVLSVFEDSRHKLWVGTSYGLNLLENWQNLDEPRFKKLTTQNGLPNNTIHAIGEDAGGNIWISTNKGLARIKHTTLEISYYQQADGLQSNEFCDGATWRDAQNHLFFGGIYGFSHFAPEHIQRSEWLPKLNMCRITLGGNLLPGYKISVAKPNRNVLSSYKVSKRENSLELDINAINYLNAEKSEYAWFLRNSNKNLLFSGTTNKINVSNLLPGRYILSAKWSNGEGLWTEEIPILQLQVRQSPWLTAGALLTYCLLIIVTIYLIYRYHQNKIAIKRQLDLEHKMRAREEEIHRNRLAFFTNIAHELQTPLTLIMGSIESRIETVARQKEPFDRVIHQQASKLTYLVQQVLEFRKAESGYLENQFSYLNISRFLSHLVEPFYSLSEQSKCLFEVKIADNITGRTDKDKIEKIVYNLLSNAFKYGDKHQKVQFQAFQKNGILTLQVANAGTEVNEEQLSKVFDQFYSNNNTDFQVSRFGTGIGLAFTRQLVQMLQGKIKAEKKDGFIWFYVKIPLPEAQESAEKVLKKSHDYPSLLFTAITDSRVITQEPTLEINKKALVENLLNSEKKKVLIVEDEPEIRYLLRDILNNEYSVFEAEDGVAALEVVNKEMPSIIVSDVMMPAMDGLELCEKIKNSLSSCHIPFILLSARGSDEHHMEGYGAGADAYIAKPFNAFHLKHRIKSLLEYRQKLHELMRKSIGEDISSSADIEDDDRKFLQSLVTLIKENIESPELNTAVIEKALFMSKMQLYRKVKSLTGMTPAEFIKNIRLKETTHLLRSTNLTVLEIFYRTGFNNQSYFFREFRKKFHCTPNEFRERFTVAE